MQKPLQRRVQHLPQDLLLSFTQIDFAVQIGIAVLHDLAAALLQRLDRRVHDRHRLLDQTPQTFQTRGHLADPFRHKRSRLLLQILRHDRAASPAGKSGHDLALFQIGRENKRAVLRLIHRVHRNPALIARPRDLMMLLPYSLI